MKSFFFAFPPFSVVTLALQKVQQDQATGILVVLDWPTQVHLVLMHLFLAPAVGLPGNPDCFNSPDNQQLFIL